MDDTEKKNKLIFEAQKLFLRIDADNNTQQEIDDIIIEYNRLIMLYNELDPESEFTVLD